MDFLRQIFGSGDYMPHGYCYLWNIRLVWLHVISDSLIALSYFAIPTVLLWIIRKRRDLPFSWMFVLFGIFIVACGMTHVMEIWNLWHASYWLSGGIKAITAAASVSTAALLINVVPRALKLPAIAQLLESNETLESQLRDMIEDESQLLASEAEYRNKAALLELTHDAIFVRDIHGKITYWNRASEYLYGWTREEAVGKTSHDLLRTKFPKPLDEIEEDILATGEWAGDLIHSRRDGSTIIVSSRWALETKANGEPVAMLESNRDITRSRRLEKRFQDLLESAPDAIVIVNQQGAIEIVNAQTEKVFGYTRKELLGKSIEILVPERLRSAHVEHRSAFAHSPHSRAMGAGHDLYARRKDGSEFPVEVSLSPLETEEGSLISSAIRDITLRHEAGARIKKLNEILEQKVAQLNLANQEVESFSYSVSHDLRAPLRHLDGFARILQDDFSSELSPEARRYLTRITEAANRMGTLIDDLLALSRIGRKEPSFRSVDLDEIVQLAVSELAPDTAERPIEWKISPLGEAECDPGLLKLVFFNLLSNAAKFTRTRTNAIIEVGKRQINGTPAFFVRDNGVGFEPKYADKLFGVFQRLHSQQQFEGTGIGLATVRRIIQRHGGQTWAESEPDRGAAFYFTLANGTSPVAQNKPEASVGDGD
jgi:PAS domain S-box-containing protein